MMADDGNDRVGSPLRAPLDYSAECGWQGYFPPTSQRILALIARQLACRTQPPPVWVPNIVQGKRLDSEVGEGARIWSQVHLALGEADADGPRDAEHRYGQPRCSEQPGLSAGGASAS